MFDNLESIDFMSDSWKIIVRVTRMWPTFSKLNDKFIGMNMIFLDSQDYHLHCFVSPNLWEQCKDFMCEGKVYQVTNFAITNATGRLRPVTSHSSIYFTHQTIAQPFPEEKIYIPLYKFEIVELGEVRHYANSNEQSDESPQHAIDVIGVVEDVQPVQTMPTPHGVKKLIQFKLYDGRQTIHVRLYDNHVACIDEVAHGNFQSFPIVVLASVRATIFGGQVEVSTLQSSRVYINPQYAAVVRIMHRLLNQGYQPHIIAN